MLGIMFPIAVSEKVMSEMALEVVIVLGIIGAWFLIFLVLFLKSIIESWIDSDFRSKKH